ncbi:MAG: DUF2493 domain-containing protein [Spirochaetaceae bacterium]|jgi:predicted Rossmann fold nucleotide-binding protein DprA/Smf involved in DNA uptake|nr:DUF2493 domain-containing protein [Spirochaetaceae bacterium]
MKLAIIGSRTIEEINFDKYIKEKPECIISGGAKGIDTLAWRWALENGIEIIVHRPNYNKGGKWSALRRNDIIIDEADKIMAFWDGRSTGTKYVIEKAKKLNKEIVVILIENEGHEV